MPSSTSVEPTEQTMEEESVPLLSQRNNSPPLPRAEHTRRELQQSHDQLPPLHDQLPPPPYQPNTHVSPKYCFDANYIKARVGESPKLKFTVTSEPPLTPDIEYSLTHYDGRIATKRFKVQHDLIEFQEVRLSDTGFYTISCTNTAGLEGKETLELEIFPKKRFSGLLKKTAAIRPLTSTSRSSEAEDVVPERIQMHETPHLNPVDNPRSATCQESIHNNAALQSIDQETLEDQETDMDEVHNEGKEAAIIVEPQAETVEEIMNNEIEDPEAEFIGHSEVESLVESEAKTTYYESMQLLLSFKILNFVFLWSIPYFIGSIIYFKKAIHDSGAGMDRRARMNFKIARCFLVVWITSNVVRVIIILLTILAICL